MSKKRSIRKPSATRRATPAPNPIPGWVWVFGVSAFLAFAGFLYYLATVPATTTEPAQATKPQPRKTTETKQQTSAPAQPSKPKEPVQEEVQFKFYEMLPESKVVTPKVEEYQSSKEQEIFHYLVQTGSFRSPEDAERQRAMVAFQGLKSSIDKVTASDGSHWYRVHVGPFESRSRMNRAVDKLVAIKIQPLVKKVKPETSASR